MITYLLEYISLISRTWPWVEHSRLVRTTETQAKKTRDENPAGDRALVFPHSLLSFFVSLFTHEVISY